MQAFASWLVRLGRLPCHQLQQAAPTVAVLADNGARMKVGETAGWLCGCAHSTHARCGCLVLVLEGAVAVSIALDGWPERLASWAHVAADICS